MQTYDAEFSRIEKLDVMTTWLKNLTCMRAKESTFCESESL